MTGKALAMLALAGGATIAAAQPAAVAGMARCDGIGDRMERLDCFDRLSQQLKGRPAAAPAKPARPAPVAAAAPAAPPVAAATPPAGFGAETVRQPREARARAPKPATTMGAVVADARQVGPGYWLFTLDDGARWQGDELRPTFQPPRRGDRVTLRRGAMGSYFLDAGRQQAMRVVRIG
ncbi:MAG: hypothetical protein PGN09_04115 [Sphingomonas fennica]